MHHLMHRSQPEAPALPRDPTHSAPSPTHWSSGDDLDDLLGDFDCAELKCASPAQKVAPVVLPSSSARSASNSQLQPDHACLTRPCAAGKQKCGTVYMGGANDVMGYQDCVGTVCCNKLRCHSCDFPVVPRQLLPACAYNEGLGGMG